MVGRVNLSSVIREGTKSAEIGYRIGQKYAGNGSATESVKLLCNKAFEEFQIEQIKAGTSTQSIG